MSTNSLFVSVTFHSHSLGGGDSFAVNGKIDLITNCYYRFGFSTKLFTLFFRAQQWEYHLSNSEESSLTGDGTSVSKSLSSALHRGTD